MTTLRSQTGSALKQGKIHSDKSEPDATLVSIDSPCPGPATPVQFRESAVVAEVEETPVLRRSRRFSAEVAIAAGVTLVEDGMETRSKSKSKREAMMEHAQKSTDWGAFCDAVNNRPLLDQRKGKRKAEESDKEAYRKKKSLAGLKSKLGELDSEVSDGNPIFESHLVRVNMQGSNPQGRGRESTDVDDQGGIGCVKVLSLNTKVGSSKRQSEAQLQLQSNQGEEGRAEARPSHRQAEAGIQSNLGKRGRAEVARARFLQIARDRASHFAHFNADGDEAPAGAPPPHAVPARRRSRRFRQVQPAQPQPEAQMDWPGPFSTARQLINNRAMAAVARQNASKSGSKVPLVNWHPSRVSGDRSFSRKLRPSLQDLCLSVIANNAENIVSLEGVPEFIRLQISSAFCERRKMNPRALSLFFQGEPSEIHVRDCTQVSESEMTEMMKQICTSHLECLHLFNCGRVMSEQCLLSTIAKPSNVTCLKSVSLEGAYRLTDKGLEALLQASPQLTHLNLRTCSYLTDAAVKAVARCSAGTLESLVLDGCPNLNATVFVHELVKLSKLQKLSLASVGGVTDGVVSELCMQLGAHLRELSVAHCISLTDGAIAKIGPCCPSLQVLNLSHIPLLTDVAVAHITDNLRNIQVLNLRKGKFSDEAVAAFVTVSGGALLNLSLNSVSQVAGQTILALARHSHACLECLDLSFCRLVEDEYLGFLVDSCMQLQELRLFGCTQVTSKFLNGHSNRGLKVSGLTLSF